ncbi:MAG TPA: aldo/keto reductase [Verrucomicrobiae bacterium]|nr:aldo/keto reductase [Verrucomicrobiae bacterium]
MRSVLVDGRPVSVVGLGCWQFGSRAWGYGSVFGAREARAIVERALELGITLFDTAEMYGRGASERILGEALGDRADSVFLATKFLPVLPTAGRLVAACEASLRRLAVERVSLYQLHFPNPIIPLSRQMEGMRRVLDRGLATHAGVSNFSRRRWLAADRALGRPILANQVRYNLLQREAERELVPFAAREGRLIIAYSPLAQGVLGGRYGPGAPPQDFRRRNPLFTPANLARASRLLDTIGEVARGHGATASQVALAYLCAQPQVVVIPGARSVAQLEANAAAADLELSADEVGRLRAAAASFLPARPAAYRQILGSLARRP